MMRTCLLILSVLMFCMSAECQTLTSTIYVDFGPNDITNGNNTASPDVNGNTWNNVSNPATSAPVVTLLNKAGSSTGFSLNITTDFLANGKLNGGLLNPSSSLLGEYAIASATQDYFYTGTSASLKISGLTPGNGYVFHLFGSRETSETRTTRYTVNGVNSSIVNLNTSGSAIGSNGYNGNNNKLVSTDTIAPDVNGAITLTVSKDAGTYAHLNLMKIQEFVSPNKYPPSSSNSTINPLKIAYFGSSVPYGQGASSLTKGYTALYSSLLKKRQTELGTKAWETVNISIPGDNTVKVLARYNSDFIPQKAKYVIYALALGNEGIHENGQPSFDQFKTNIVQLIKQAKDAGYAPIVTNSYTRNDYNSTDYNYIKQMNLFLAQLDVPSINLLGAVDDGSGRWTNGYWTDSLHPNDGGHEEMFYTIVPSLFDALDQNKAIPQKLSGSYVTLVKNNSQNKGASIQFNPENTVHSFTNTFSIKTSVKGVIAEIKEASGTAYLSITAHGKLQYTSSKTGTITGNTVVNDNNWHTITLTHYYARGETFLYCDNISDGSKSEKLMIQQVNLGALSNTGTALCKEWLFYRSGMNADEINAIASGNFLKSSLELYAPLDGKKTVTTDSLINLAQSTNVLYANLAVLPLNLISFSATKSTTGIKLNWQTANEVNVKGFWIERRSQNTSFAPIDNVINPGKSVYSFDDTDVTAESNYYYRLVIIDNDGSLNYSPVIAGVFNINNPTEFNVYPNPFSDKITINHNASDHPSLVIRDLKGRTIKQEKLNAFNTTSSLPELEKGLYIFTLIEGNKSTNKLIVKN